MKLSTLRKLAEQERILPNNQLFGLQHLEQKMLIINHIDNFMSLVGDADITTEEAIFDLLDEKAGRNFSDDEMDAQEDLAYEVLGINLRYSGPSI